MPWYIRAPTTSTTASPRLPFLLVLFCRAHALCNRLGRIPRHGALLQIKGVRPKVDGRVPMSDGLELDCNIDGLRVRVSKACMRVPEA